MNPSFQPTDEELGRFVRRQLDDGERQRIEEYAADCDETRQQLVAAWRQSKEEVEPVAVPPELLAQVKSLVPERSDHSSPDRPFWLRPPAMAAMAAIALLTLAAVLLPRGLAPGGAPVEAPTLRGGGISALEVLSPTDGATLPLSAGGVSFAWQAEAKADESYRLVILDATGQRVYERELSSASWELDAKILGEGQFYWTVTWLRGDGSSLQSPRHELRLLE